MIYSDDRHFEYPQDLPTRSALEKIKGRFPELDVGAMETTLQFLRAANDVMGALEAHFAAYGISYGKFTLMMLLYRYLEDGLSPYELADKAGVTRGTITGLLDGLEKVGYVRRDRHPNDRRRLIVRLTDAGREFLEGMLPDHFERMARMMGGVEEAERERFLEYLHRVCNGTAVLRGESHRFTA